MAKVPNAENFNRPSRAHRLTNVTDRQTTDDRRTGESIANVNMSSRSPKYVDR